MNSGTKFSVLSKLGSVALFHLAFSSSSTGKGKCEDVSKDFGSKEYYIKREREKEGRKEGGREGGMVSLPPSMSARPHSHPLVTGLHLDIEVLIATL